MELLQIDQKISINIVKQDKLVEIIGKINQIFDDRIEIELPKYFMRYVEYLEVGKSLTAKVFSKLGTVDFNSVVLSSPLEDAFRIELDYNAIKLTPSDNAESIDAIEKVRIKRNDVSFMARTMEISTEKVKILCDADLTLQENINCELLLPEDYGIISFKATVIEKDEIYDDEYILSCYAINEDDRQTLLYYMYVYANGYNQQEEQ